MTGSSAPDASRARMNATAASTLSGRRGSHGRRFEVVQDLVADDAQALGEDWKPGHGCRAAVQQSIDHDLAPDSRHICERFHQPAGDRVVDHLNALGADDVPHMAGKVMFLGGNDVVGPVLEQQVLLLRGARGGDDCGAKLLGQLDCGDPRAAARGGDQDVLTGS